VPPSNVPNVYPGQVFGGDPMYQGLTLGDFIVPASGVFIKADYPGVRAIRLGNGRLLQTVSLPDSYSVPGWTGGGYTPGDPVLYTTPGAVELWY
jgi:hypothetical protein